MGAGFIAIGQGDAFRFPFAPQSLDLPLKGKAAFQFALIGDVPYAVEDDWKFDNVIAEIKNRHTGRDGRYPGYREVILKGPPWPLASGRPCRNDGHEELIGDKG